MNCHSQLRTEVVKSLAKTTALTLDSLQQTARAVKVITDQTDEISEECQVRAATLILCLCLALVSG